MQHFKFHQQNSGMHYTMCWLYVTCLQAKGNFTGTVFKYGE